MSPEGVCVCVCKIRGRRKYQGATTPLHTRAVSAWVSYTRSRARAFAREIRSLFLFRDAHERECDHGFFFG